MKLDNGRATAHLVLLPTPPVTIVSGCDVCACDLDSVVAGVDTSATGGCTVGHSLYESAQQRTARLTSLAEAFAPNEPRSPMKG